jgi:RNA recognition motif-containing protein
MAVKLYVGNLPYSTTDDDLRTLFAEYGTVESTAVISDRETGRSKGFGFVELSSKEEADKAIEALNGKDNGGRNLVVNEARPREERPAGGAPRGNGGGGFRQRSW